MVLIFWRNYGTANPKIIPLLSSKECCFEVLYQRAFCSRIKFHQQAWIRNQIQLHNEILSGLIVSWVCHHPIMGLQFHKERISLMTLAFYMTELDLLDTQHLIKIIQNQLKLGLRQMTGISLSKCKLKDKLSKCSS